MIIVAAFWRRMKKNSFQTRPSCPWTDHQRCNFMSGRLFSRINCQGTRLCILRQANRWFYWIHRQILIDFAGLRIYLVPCYFRGRLCHAVGFSSLFLIYQSCLSPQQVVRLGHYLPFLYCFRHSFLLFVSHYLQFSDSYNFLRINLSQISCLHFWGCSHAN